MTWWYELVLPRVGLARLAERSRSKRMRRIAQQFHALAAELGGLMIKVGQFMSSRLDVLPPEITAELAGLQDEVAPVPFAELRALAERELGVPLARAFASVEDTPVAAASLGQAHRARALASDAEASGIRDVILKVQRPGIDEIVAIDLAALRKVGRWLSRVRVVSRRADMPALVEEFASTSREEIDYLHEAANLERFGENFAADARVAVPGLLWERCTRRVLTMEDVTAIKISDTAGLRAAGIDPADVAPVFASVMFDQLFTHGFFHADPHPGNIFVTPRPAGVDGPPWTLTFIDFGMMGEIPDSTRSGLRALLIAAATRSGPELVAAMRDMGVLLPSADTAVLERAMTQLFARFGGMGFAELREVDPGEFRDFGREFNDVVRTLPFQLPENFLLVVRAMSLTSGVCSTLDPRFNLWDSAEPYAAGMLRDERGGLAGDLGRQALEIAGIAWRLPKRAEALLGRFEAGTVAVATPSLDRRIEALDRTARRLWSAVIFGGLIVAGAVLVAGHPGWGWGLMGLAVLPLLHTLFSGRSGPRG